MNHIVNYCIKLGYILLFKIQMNNILMNHTIEMLTSV